MNKLILSLSVLLLVTNPGFNPALGDDSDNPASEQHIILLATNDIHGGVEPTKLKDGALMGGMALWAGIVKAIRQGIAARPQSRDGVLVLDAGDQFQGTLISNYNEGQLVFAAMDRVGYDAVIPGNHDYDFGPIGWLVDKSPDPSKRREALERLAGQVHFPLLSANTFLKDSIKDKAGNPVQVDSKLCKPITDGAQIDWSSAKQPAIFKPWVIKEVAGVRVALIGLDNPMTSEITTVENVDDLCFADAFEIYKDVRQKLADQADVFVLIIHSGNSKTGKDASRLAEQIARLPGGGVDAVISGHTHDTYNEKVSGIPVIQSGFGGGKFGRIDLVWDSKKKKIVQSKTRSVAGVRIYGDHCDDSAKTFCDSSGGSPSYEGVPLVSNSEIEGLIAKGREAIQPLAGRHLGVAAKEIRYDRIDESPLADLVTDALKAKTGAEVSMVNTGGLRTSLPAGEVTYEDFFKVLPFNNHAVLVGPMPMSKLMALLQRSVQTCGDYGSLMESGLRLTFSRQCDNPTNRGGVDRNAKLLHVETTSGEVLYDLSAGTSAPSDRSFQVATLDFLADGGAGYDGFKGTPLTRDFGVAREIITDVLLENPAHWDGNVDDRWKLITQ